MRELPAILHSKERGTTVDKIRRAFILHSVTSVLSGNNIVIYKFIHPRLSSLHIYDP